MKKIISMLLALFMLVGFLSMPAFAEEIEMTDVIEFEEVLTKQSNNGHFTLSANKLFYSDGWLCNNNNTITICAVDNQIIITSIEAVIGQYPWHYDCLVVSKGVKQEYDNLKIGDTVTVTNINEPTFSFTSDVPNNNVFQNINVHYKEHTHSFGDDGKCSCGKMKCEVEDHSYGKDNVCVYCGVTKCDVEGHSYEKGVCTRCGHECENEFHNGVYACPDCDMEFDPSVRNPAKIGSVFAGGSLTIIVGVAAAVLFGVGGFFLGIMKKKPAIENGASDEDSEKEDE